MMSDPSSRRTAARRALILIVTLVLASAGREARGTDLIVSNRLPKTTTPPNPSYGTVEVVQKPSDVVEFTVTPTMDYYQTMGNKFGVANFTFKTNLTLAATDITVTMPSIGFTVAPLTPTQTNPFGSFDWLVTSAKGTKKLVFHVHSPGATPANFLIANTNGAMFAAEVIDFTVTGAPGVTYHWVSNQNAVHTAVKKDVVDIAGKVTIVVGILLLVGFVAWRFLRDKRPKVAMSGDRGITDIAPG